MDEAVAGHASFIEVTLEPDNWLTVRDNGRGIPVDPHPKFKNLSALEVILTTLHSGGKFGGKVYATSGGLHGVGSSVVNALSAAMEVEVARDRVLWKQSYARGKPTTKLVNAGPVHNRRGTSIRFKPDPTVFGGVGFSPGAAVSAVPLQGLSVPWRADPLGVRSVAAAVAARTTRRPRRCCISRAACATAWKRKSARRPGCCRSPGRARRTCQAAPAGWNGRRPGWRKARGSSTPTATPSRRRRAARTRPGFAPRC